MGENTIKSLLRTDNNAEPQKIGFLLLNEFSMIAFASAIEPLRAANRQSNQTLFDWVVASTDGNASTASNGMTVQTATETEELQSCRMVFVCSGVRVRENTNKSILNLIRRLDRNGAIIGAICTGTYVMAGCRSS
jgi:transcriptional regulator GlxA family with amidase domain